MLDVRKPIGYMFVVVGAILVIYGIVQPQITTLTLVGEPASYQLNLDLPWGFLMFVFGAIMLVLAQRDAKKTKP